MPSSSLFLPLNPNLQGVQCKFHRLQLYGILQWLDQRKTSNRIYDLEAKLPPLCKRSSLDLYIAYFRAWQKDGLGFVLHAFYSSNVVLHRRWDTPKSLCDLKLTKQWQYLSRFPTRYCLAKRNDRFYLPSVWMVIYTNESKRGYISNGFEDCKGSIKKDPRRESSM